MQIDSLSADEIERICQSGGPLPRGVAVVLDRPIVLAPSHELCWE